MRILNKKNNFIISAFCLISIASLKAQDSTNQNSVASNEGDFTKQEIIQQPEAKVTINQDPKIKRLLDLKTKMDTDGVFSDRYKIQLYYGDLNKANNIMKTANESFLKWKPSIQWETPNYKVWIGNYRNRLEADRALKEIREKFPNAFIFKPERK